MAHTAGAWATKIALGLAATTLGLPIATQGSEASAARLLASRSTPTIQVHQLLLPAHRATPTGSVLFTCQNPGAISACYGPDQIRTAYQVQPLLNRGIAGRGRTIVIVIAYSPPGPADDLNTFNAAWGLPPADFHVIAPYGSNWDPTSAEQIGWAVEADLDTQWAHVIAPAAKIVLLEAKSSSDADLIAADQYAVEHHLGDVVSHSFGDAEHCLSASLLKHQHEIFDRAVQDNITLVAAAGDQGSAQPTCDYTSFAKDVLNPAADPDVLAVGGTHLLADPTTGAYQSETVWNESSTAEAAAGGGYSTAYSRPSYQAGSVLGRKRGVPDVAYGAATHGGVLLYFGLGGGWFNAGGTSVGTPQWAGLVALADQLAGGRLGFVNPTLYGIGRSAKAASYFHDVVTGDNAFTYLDASGALTTIPGYTAGRGWDAASGLGSPIVSALVPRLATDGR